MNSMSFRLMMTVAALAICGTAWANEATPTTKKVDVVKGEQIFSAQCAACHGSDGNSLIPINPKLAGQHAAYLYQQLQNFQTKSGATEPERANPVMSGMAASLSEEDMRNVAAFLSSKTIKLGSATGDKTSIELGQKIYRGGLAEKNVPACAACHGPTGAGIPAQFPRLGGQHAEYTAAQLVAFRAGVRKNEPMMVSIAARLSDAEIKAVSDYIAGLR